MSSFLRTVGREVLRNKLKKQGMTKVNKVLSEYWKERKSAKK